MYDQDYGFGLWPASIYVPAMARDYADYDNMFRFYTAGTGTSDGWPNAGGRTFMLRSLLANAGFKERFIRRCADFLNSHFREDRVVQTLEEMSSNIRPEIPSHLDRWNWASLTNRGFGRPHQREYQPFTRPTWESNLTVVAAFGRSRPAKLRQDCISHFRLTGGLGTLSLDVTPTNSASIHLNSLRLDVLPWSGEYFVDVASTLTVVPRIGFRFAGWSTPEGVVMTPQLTLKVASNAVTRITAILEPAVPPGASPSDLVVSEFQYNPGKRAETHDWIEIHNPGTSAIDLSGWILRDKDDLHAFLLPRRTLQPGAFLVLTEDDYQFRIFHPANSFSRGDLGFGLDNDWDVIRLYRPDGSEGFKVSYQDAAPWPSEADGTGRTLQLSSPTADPSLPASWKLSADAGGTPGRP